MPNYNVQYVGPANMLLSLRDELNAVMPNRFTGTDGFITGYGQFGRSSHNPNNHGHVMAFDISTPADGQNITEHMGRSLADHLRTKVNENFKYLIHDMSAGAPEGKIAGDFSNWEWRIYGGDAHSNHIHISLTNDYLWGDDCGLSPDIYNRRVSWGIAAWYAAYTGKAPAPSKPAPAPAKVSFDQIVKDVIAGKAGNGDARTWYVRNRGHDAEAVQREVNRRLLPAAAPVNIDALARAVIRGEYGNGADRARRLGANANAVQARVNQLLG